MKKLFTFLLIWLCSGFTLGTLMLLGPLRMTVDYGRKNLWSASAENKTVIGFIVLLAIVSAAIAWFVANKIADTKISKNAKLGLYGAPVLGIVFSIFVFMHPTWLSGNSPEKSDITEGAFSFGSYPEEEKMQQLKDDGFTGVISLLHPAIVPFEPTLLEQEKKNADKAGLRFVNIPLLPWISDNKESIDSLRRLVRNVKGKYYVHCYLGRDRVNAAMTILQQETRAVNIEAVKATDKDLMNLKFERGAIVVLDKDVYLAPFPTKEEFLRVIAGVKQVVSLSDNTYSEAALRTKQEQQWFTVYNIPFKAYYVNGKTSREKMQAVVDSVKALPKPIFIHGFFADDPALVVFQSLYKASLH